MRPSRAPLRLLAPGLLLLLASCRGPLALVRERAPAPGVAPDASGVTFYYADPSASDVWVAGEFNRWTAQRGNRFLVEMKRGADDRWSVTIPYKEKTGDPRFDHLSDDVYVEHGRRYMYKIVIDTNRWLLDPSNRSVITEPDGNQNSLLVAP